MITSQLHLSSVEAIAYTPALPSPGALDRPVFKSFAMGGIESSTQRLRNGYRLDVIATSGHDRFFVQDYARLRRQGLTTIRSALRWHLIEYQPYHYDFSSVLPMIRAARAMGLQVIWDIFHYGWPDDLDILSPAFVDRLAGLSRAFARVLKAETNEIPVLVPMNEISFMAWGGGKVGYLNPFQLDKGWELKRQLVRAGIAATEAIWAVIPSARIVFTDPAINIVPATDQPDEIAEAEFYCQVQYEAWDMLAGRVAPELGGHPKYLDILGINYYPLNQWVHRAETLLPGEARYRPFRELLAEIHKRYGRPLFIAETGAEDEARPTWLHYVSEEMFAAIAHGVPVNGICLYPIFNHPGWDDGRHCHNGLWDYADESTGARDIYPPLANELTRLQWQGERVRQSIPFFSNP